MGAGPPQLAAERAPLRALQGLSKAETAARFGEPQVHAWRRSYATRPPLLKEGDPRWERADPRYAALSDAELPLGESLADTIARVLPYWRGAIAPALRTGQRVLVVAHGNSLRGLVMHLDRLGEEEIAALDHRYLGAPADVAAAVARVVEQGRAAVPAADSAAVGAKP